MNKRLLLSSGLALIAVASALPYWFGVEAERIFNAQIGQIDVSGKIHITDNRFQRGWLRSDAETTLSIKDSGIAVFAQHTIEHGPFPASNPLRFLVSLQPLQALIRSRLWASSPEQAATDKPIGTLLTTVNIDGSTHTRLEIPTADIQLERSATLAWESVSGDVYFLPTNTFWQGEIHIEGARWQQNNAKLSSGRSLFSFESNQGSTGLTMGSSTLRTDSFKASLPGMPGTLHTQGLVIDSTASEKDQNVSYSLNSRVDSADLSDIKIIGGNWTLTANDLDLGSLTRLIGLEAGEALPLNELVGMVTKRRANFASKLKAETNSGPLTANATLLLDGDGNSNNPLLLLSAVQGEVDLNIPPSIVEMVAQSSLAQEYGGLPQGTDNAVPHKIESWIDANLLTREGENYRLRASINNGSVRLNNKPFNLMSLLVR